MEVKLSALVEDGMDAHKFIRLYGEGLLWLLKAEFEVFEQSGKLYRM